MALFCRITLSLHETNVAAYSLQIIHIRSWLYLLPLLHLAHKIQFQDPQKCTPPIIVVGLIVSPALGKTLSGHLTNMGSPSLVPMLRHLQNRRTILTLEDRIFGKFFVCLVNIFFVSKFYVFCRNMKTFCLFLIKGLSLRESRWFSDFSPKSMVQLHLPTVQSVDLPWSK